jgi:hypothetical protein
MVIARAQIERARERERERASGRGGEERVYWEQVILHIKILYSYCSNSRVPDGRTQEVGVDMFGEAGDHER